MSSVSFIYFLLLQVKEKQIVSVLYELDIKDTLI